MCAIAGILHLDHSPAAEAELAGVSALLAHRGPDGAGAIQDGPCALAHRRLAILDPSSAAAQPMTSADRRYTVVHNGEIYNFLELRAELAAAGATFRSDGDTEVVLAAFARWGPACQERFNGMWAFAIWDAETRRLFLSRDRFGQKPLFFAVTADRFAFASELKGFLGLPWLPCSFDDGVIALSLTGSTVGDAIDRSLLRGVTRLRAGHCLTVSLDRPVAAPRRWWNTLAHLPEVPAAPAEQAEQLRALVLDACRLRVRSDVPVASAVSGGLDSAVVHAGLVHSVREGAAVARRPDDWLRAFVACFPGTAQDERAYAEAVIATVGSRGVFLEITPDAVADHLEDMVYAHEAVFDQPLSPWLLYRAMAGAGVRVSLDGHGGDELFCGYHQQVHDVVFRTFDPDQKALFKTVRDRLPVPGAGRPAPAFDPRQGLRVQPCTVSFPERPGDEAALDRFDPLSRRLYMDFHYGTLPNILANFDRASMAHGVEVRAPLLDWRLVCYALALPWTAKVAGGWSKYLLRRTFADLVPETVAWRPTKLGFVTPFAAWRRPRLHDRLCEIAHSAEQLNSPIWDGPAIARGLDEAVRRDDTDTVRACWPFLHAALLQGSFRTRRAAATAAHRH